MGLHQRQEKRRRLKQISQPSSANQTSYSIQTNLVSIMQHSSSARTLKVKLHKLPPSVASAASEHPLGINQHTLKPKEFMCIFYLSDDHYPIDQPSTSKYYVDNRHWDSPTGLKQVLKHYILSFEQLFCDSNVASNGLHPILAIPNRTHRGLQATSSGLESVSDRQKHSESLVSGGVQGPHHPHRKQWISFHRNPPGNRRGNAHLPHISRSSSLLSQNGKKSPFEAPTFPRCDEEEGGRTRGSIHSGLHSGQESSRPSGPLRPTRGRGRCPNPYVWDRDYSQVTRPQLHHLPALGYGNNQIRTLIGGRYPTASSLSPQNSMQSRNQHRRQFPLLTSAEVASRIGSYRDPNTPPDSPTRPGPRVRHRVASWEMQPLGHAKRLSGTYVPEREPDEIESPGSHRQQGSRPSTPQSPAPVHQPIPATRLRGGFAGVE